MNRFRNRGGVTLPIKILELARATFIPTPGFPSFYPKSIFVDYCQFGKKPGQ